MRGHELERSFSRKAREYETIAEKAEADVARLDGIRTSATQSLAKALKGLAEVQLDNGDYSSVIGDELERRSAEEDRARSLLIDVENRIGVVSINVEKLRTEAARLEETAGQVLVNHEAWKNASERAKELVKDNDLKQYRDLQDECKSKIVLFNNDPFFCYLKSVKYGTDDYKNKGLTKLIDGWMASLTGFRNNNENFVLLQLILNKSIEGEEALRPKLKALNDEKDALWARLSRDVGLTSEMEKLERETKILNGLKSQANGLHDELDNFANKRDRYYARIVQQVQDGLKRLNIKSLTDRAALTDCVKDDKLVEDISRAQAVIDEVEPQLKEAMDRLVVARSNYDKAKSAERHARKQINSSNRHYRSSINVDDLVAGYVLGSIALGDIGERIQSQSYRPESSSSSFSGGFGESSSSSFGGGFSSSSSFGGGGFSTTDSF